MKPEKYMDEDLLIKKSINILMDKLGPTETFRFLTLPREKRIESVKCHRGWQKTLNKDEFFDEIFGK